MRSRLLAISAVFLLAACGKLNELPTGPGNEPPPDPSATFTRIKTEILPTCGAPGCHGRIAPQHGMILEPDRAYAMIVSVPSVENPSLHRIEPGSPQNSYLYRKIIGVGITGDRMPQGGPYLNDAEIALIRDWIRRGAPND